MIEVLVVNNGQLPAAAIVYVIVYTPAVLAARSIVPVVASIINPVVDE